MKRVPTTELLDSDAGTPKEIAGSVSDLWFINRAFGGVSTTLALVGHVAQQASLSTLSLLEVASGRGEVPNEVGKRLRHDGIDVRVTLLDRAPSHLNGARRALVGDALRLPFRAESFDVVSSNLFLHHLSPRDLHQFVGEALRVCRTAVIINDLIRNPLHLAMVYAGLPLFRSRLTWHDAPASVRQAYTVEEMRVLLAGTPAARIEISRHYLFRMGIIAWKR